MDMKKNVTQTSLIFVINGEKFELSNIDPSTTLLEFLPTQTSFKSVKLGCGEGKRAFIAGVADDNGYGWAIAKSLAAAGASWHMDSWKLLFYFRYKIGTYQSIPIHLVICLRAAFLNPSCYVCR
ncbi:uncharacterized protein LOC131642526 isoform X2 [Vicia villosa]|uniref:uncharacterized protein LOC131642526 isoform X2 n=1 Tax=Vicia villosa TaxID=3911 RepID=UPI00273C9B5A|nr:uncharacterized protein LOC131642526 isoform X2 [Vicia villosa]